MNINFSYRKKLNAAISFRKNRKIAVLFVRAKSWLRVTIKETVFAGEFRKSRKRQANEIERCAVSCRYSLCSRSLFAAEPGDRRWNYMTGLAGFLFSNRYSYTLAIFCRSTDCNVSFAFPLRTEVRPFKFLRIVYLPMSYPNLKPEMYKNSALLSPCMA
jgi:hypothetical protein